MFVLNVPLQARCSSVSVLEYDETYFGSVLSGRGGGTAVQADSRRVGPCFSVATLLMLAGLLLLSQMEISGFDPKAALWSSAAGGVGEHRLIV